MTNTHHTLIEEFPQHREAILGLKTSNAHFSKMLEAYGALDKEIYKARSDITPTDDLHLTEMHKKRLTLKDELFAMIQKEASARA